MAHAPFFIVSAPRSGSTLLRLLLTAHPELCVPPESKFLVRLYDQFGDVTVWDETRIHAFLIQLQADKKFSEWGVPGAMLRERLSQGRFASYAQVVDAVYRAHLERTWPGARIWGDKNPGYRAHISTILAVFPEAKIIHLVRDVRAVYLSMKNVARKNDKSPLGKIARATQKWQLAIREARRHEKPSQFLTVRYEDLVADTERTLTTVCEFLGVSFHPRMLEFHADNAAKGLVPETHLSKHGNTLKPVTSQRVNAWQSEVSPVEIEAIEFRNREVMIALGYQPVTNRLSARGAARLAGDCLGLLALPVVKLFGRRHDDADEEDEEPSACGA